MQKLYILEKCKFYISPSIYVNLECKFFQKCKSMENVNLQFSQTQGRRSCTRRSIDRGDRIASKLEGSGSARAEVH